MVARKRKKKRLRIFPFIFICMLGILFACVIVKYIPSSVPASVPNVNASYTSTSAIDKSAYKKVKMSKDDIHKGPLILVNHDYAFQFPEVDNLANVYDSKNGSYKVKDKNVELDKEAMEPFNQMLSDFKKEKGRSDIMAISGYRTKDFQQQLLEEEIQKSNKEEAAKWVAKPGHSEHHTGYAMDIGIYTDSGRSEQYKGTGKYAWINQNCYKYGFIVRYPEEKADITKISYEPWHFRYVGKAHSHIIAEMGICYEEYIEFLKGYEYGKQHLLVKDSDNKEYEIYYVKAGLGKTNVPVSNQHDSQISGNNVDGFIVTTQLFS